jgi:hypothetical protein
LQLQDVAACNAPHSVERRMGRSLLQLHDSVAYDVLPLTQETRAQLLGVGRTTVTLTVAKLRRIGAIKSARPGFVEVDRARLESMACGCYAVMQSRIDRTYEQELSAHRVNRHYSDRPTVAAEVVDRVQLSQCVERCTAKAVVAFQK